VEHRRLARRFGRGVAALFSLAPASGIFRIRRSGGLLSPFWRSRKRPGVLEIALRDAIGASAPSFRGKRKPQILS